MRVQVALAIVIMTSACTSAKSARPPSQPLVRLAELGSIPLNWRATRPFSGEEIVDVDSVEPGVLNLYAVAVKGQPAQIRIFEMYADTAVYEAHVQTPHFLSTRPGTQDMVKSLRLVETDPVLLGAK